MSPKKAFIYLAILAALILAGFGVFYLMNRNSEPTPEFSDSVNNKNSSPATSTININEVIEKKNNQKKLTPEEESALNQAIDKKAGEKVNEITKSAAKRDFKQDEVDFILNPKQGAAEELGIKNEESKPAASKLMSQEEINSILNPKK